MGPFIKSNNKTDKIMKNLIIALIPIILFNEYKNGYLPYIKNKTDLLGLFYPLIVLLASICTTYFTEFIVCKITKKEQKYSIIPGIFIALILPLNTPIEILIFACILSIVIGKMVYGGYGHNIFNPALIGCLFVLTAYSSIILNNGGYLNSYEVDTIAGATPLSNVSGLGTYNNLVKPYGSLLDFFLGFIPGSPGETSSLLCLISFLYLAFTKTIKTRISVIYILTVFLMTGIIGYMNNLGIWYPLFHILSGGLMFGAIFMATDPVTSPVTKYGQILYGFCLGIITVVARFLTPYPEGVLTSILIMNLFVFMLDRIGIRNKDYIKKIIISSIILLIIFISIIFSINNSFKNKSDNDFNILEKENINDTLVYIVTEKGFKGNIKAKVEIKNNKVITYEILECSDDYLNVVLKEDYLNKLKENKNIDTVSGATKTSTALKKLINNVIKDSES